MIQGHKNEPNLKKMGELIKSTGLDINYKPWCGYVLHIKSLDFLADGLEEKALKVCKELGDMTVIIDNPKITLEEMRDCLDEINRLVG